MNCRFPDVTNLRCWLCPHNPHLYDLPIMSVHAILKREEAERVRRPCWEDDEEFHNFDLLVPLPGELDDELTEMLADIGYPTTKMMIGRMILKTRKKRKKRTGQRMILTMIGMKMTKRMTMIPPIIFPI